MLWRARSSKRRVTAWVREFVVILRRFWAIPLLLQGAYATGARVFFFADSRDEITDFVRSGHCPTADPCA